MATRIQEVGISKYYRNFLLCGDIDYHCLLCKESFGQLETVEKHIRWEIHRKRLKLQIYMAKYKKDKIYKLENTYYCEICNYITEGKSLLSAHVDGHEHKTNKERPRNEIKNIIRDEKHGFVIIASVAINYYQWNCIIDDKCILCNCVVNSIADKDSHIASSSHLINIIKNKCTKYETNNQYYRKINEEIFYCFICEKTFPMSSLSRHCTETEHSNNASRVETAESPPELINPVNKLLGVQMKLIQAQFPNFNMSTTTEIAYCNICRKVIKLIYSKMLKHNKKKHEVLGVIEDDEYDEPKIPGDLNFVIIDYGLRRAKAAKFGRENFMKLTYGGRRGYCLLCNVYTSPIIRGMRQHIKGSRHTGFLELKGAIEKKEHEKPDFLKETTHIRSYLSELLPSSKGLTLRLNDTKYLLCIFSLYFLDRVLTNPHYVKTICYACDEVLPQEATVEQEHINSVRHLNIFNNSGVIRSLKDEFVREVRPDVYHCGFCNMIFPFWENLKTHIVKEQHKKMRQSREIRTAPTRA